MKRAILIIGIDGGTWTVLKPAMDGGYMPYLKSCVESGSSGILQSTMPAKTPAAWGSFQTGVNPGKNGVFDFHFWDKKNKKIKYVSSDSLQTTIWQYASMGGKRIGVINLPMTYPPKKINGCVITGMLTPSIKSDFTYPLTLKKQLLKAVPDYHIFNLKNAKAGAPHENFERFVQYMVTVIENRVKAARFLLQNNSFDIFMLHFQATDVIQHALWCFLDRTHSLYNSDKRDYIFDIFYRSLDKNIRHICELFEKSHGRDYTTLIVSDHGFETHNKRFNIGNWLQQHGFLKLNPRASHLKPLKRLTKKIRVGNFLKYFFAEETINKIDKSLKWTPACFDWQNTKSFSFGASGEGYILLLEENAEQREKTASEIIQGLKAIRDPETNAPVIKEIYRKEDIYSGEYMDRMPDIVIESTSGYTFTGAHIPNQGLYHKVCLESDFHMGKHHKDGIIIASGKHIQTQQSIFAQLIDITPTLLYYLQLPINSHIDGRVIMELFTDEFKKQNKSVEKTDLDLLPRNQKQKQYSDQDENEIQQRLKDLGYL